jgi:deoxyribodipyrimidine photo-lyase
MSCVIWWVRRDLRLADNPALQAAIATGLPVLPVYLHVPHEDADWRRGAASRVWLERSLQAFAQSLEKLGMRLLVRKSEDRSQSSLSLLESVIAESKAQAIVWQRQYEPSALARDKAIKTTLKTRLKHVESVGGYLLHEPWQLSTGSGEVYRVFTPYWRKARSALGEISSIAAPSSVHGLGHKLASIAISALGLRSEKTAARDWDRGFFVAHTPGEAGAKETLEVFIQGALQHYISGRDRPDQAGTSRLSAALHFGEISVRQAASEVLRSGMPSEQCEFFLRELGWRDFSYQLLYHFPHIHSAPLNAKYAGFPWNEDQSPQAQRLLRAWKFGQTGIPIIDAGMRELWHTGWMHNRVRMLVASYLTKNLRLHWLHGARWFWHTLVDADLANNTQGWQWSAGCGADAAPYFRIFNPVTQGEKFDPNGDYVRRFVPELAKLSGAAIHQPWAIGGVKGYPNPAVDLKATRESALAAFSAWRQ